MTGACILHGAGHGCVAQPGAEGIHDPLTVGEPAIPWPRHQEHTHKLSAYAKQQPVGDHCVGKGAPCAGAQSVPHYNETSDDVSYHLGFGALLCCGMRQPSHAHPIMAKGVVGQLSHHDWFEAPAGPGPTLLQPWEDYGLQQPPVADWGHARPYPQVHLAQMPDFQGDGKLDIFREQVDELSQFIHWDEHETCHQA